MPFSSLRSLSAIPHMLSSLPVEGPHFRFGSFLSILPAWQDLASSYPFVPRVRVLRIWGSKTLPLLSSAFTYNSDCSLSVFASAVFAVYIDMCPLFNYLTTTTGTLQLRLYRKTSMTFVRNPSNFPDGVVWSIPRCQIG